MQFDWDVAKAFQNRQKHGVTFDEATSVIFDPFAITTDAEERFITVGCSTRSRLLMVVHMERTGDVIRAVY